MSEGIIIKINTQVIYDNLFQSMNVQRFGSQNEPLKHNKLRFFDSRKELNPNCIYVIGSDLLHANPMLARAKNMSLICVGGKPPPDFLLGYHNILLFDECYDIIDVYSAVQGVFERYEAWDEELQQILNSNTSLKDLVHASIPIFENRISITDSSLRFSVDTQIETISDKKINFYVEDSSEPLPVGIVKTFKDANAYDRQIREPYFYDNKTCYCKNIYLKSQFICNVALTCEARSFLPSDFALMNYFFQIIQTAIEKQTKLLDKGSNALKTVIVDLLNRVNIDDFSISIIKNHSNSNSQYYCIKIRQLNEPFGLPEDYICSALAGILSGAITFQYETSIVGFIDTKKIQFDYGQQLQAIEQFLKDFGLIAGVSKLFNNFMYARSYYRQACCAIEMGSALNPDRLIYCFSDYILCYMLAQSLGEFTIETLSPELMNFKEFSDSSTVDYWETLRVLLDNEMNTTKASNKLFIHRTTLLQRLERIYNKLNIDLDDPEQRLYLQMCLKAIDWKNQIPNIL